MLDTPNNPVPLATTTTYAQKQLDRFATFRANRKEVEKARSDGFISKKDQLKPKGKFEVGSKKEVKVFVWHQLLNILLHAARRAMAAAACRCPSLLLTRKTTALFLRYAPFLPPDQLARS